ncbi:Chemotaxis protein CheY [Rickettsiales bacterium Ac37b]|nr:Chemotaxis protein CheY [Rickettsiales bacterium Ac37b]
MDKNIASNQIKLEEVKYSPALAQGIKQKKKERTGVCILIAESQILSRQLMLEALRLRWNYETIATKNAIQTIKSYINNAPDILFLDAELSDYNGYDVLTKIKEIDVNAFVIMTSTVTLNNNVQLALKNGAQGFIAKPFTKSKIEEYINIYVDKYKKMTFNDK